MLRGTKTGLEFVFGAEADEAAFGEMSERLAERPDFYRGSRAAAIFNGAPPAGEGFAAFLETVRAHGIELHGVYGSAELAAFAEAHALPFLGEPPRPVAALYGVIVPPWTTRRTGLTSTRCQTFALV